MSGKPRILGLDFGTRRIGVAISDALGLTAQPLTTVINRGERACEEITSLVHARQAAYIVMGLPLHMNGSEGEKAREARAFGERLAGRAGVRVEYIDERLTTVSVQRMLGETRLSGPKKRQMTDKLAAVLILQTWMDSRAS